MEAKVKVEMAEEPSGAGEEPLFRPPLSSGGKTQKITINLPLSRQSLMENQVHFLKLIPRYRDQVGSPIMVTVLKTEPMSEGEEPLFRPPLPAAGKTRRVIAKLPLSRQPLLDEGVHFLELILKYEDQEGTPMKIDLRGEAPLIKEEKLENPVMEVDTTDDQLPPPLLVSPPDSKIEANLGAVASITIVKSSRRIAITKKNKPKHNWPSCSNCKKNFSNKANLKQHLFVHLNPEEKDAVRQGWRNKCNFCSKRFQTPSKLERHLLGHTTEKPYKCYKCRKQFSQRSV